LQTVYRFALEEALLRRVVAFGWSLPDADRLRALIPDDLEQLGTELRRRRAKVLGPHALCDQCPHPCLWQYEGARLANEAHTEDEVADVIDGADGDVSLRLRETLTRATERLLGPSAALVASGPSYCALTHLVTRWDLSQRASTSVLKLMKEVEPSA
jgi:hypothetical protein